MRTAPLWVIMQRAVVIAYRRFGTNYRSHRQGVLNYSSLRNNLQERSSFLCIIFPTFHTYNFSTLSSAYSRILLLPEEFDEQCQNFKIIEHHFLSSIYFSRQILKRLQKICKWNHSICIAMLILTGSFLKQNCKIFIPTRQRKFSVLSFFRLRIITVLSST